MSYKKSLRGVHIRSLFTTADHTHVLGTGPNWPLIFLLCHLRGLALSGVHTDYFFKSIHRVYMTLGSNYLDPNVI